MTITFLLIAGIAWFTWNRVFPTAELHYRLDVTFEVDGKPVTGSSVHKFTAKRLRGLNSKQFLLTATGEAVVVDMPGRRSVFVLLTTPTPDGTYTGGTKGRYDFILVDACNLWKKRNELGPSGFVRFLDGFTGSCEVPAESLPLMVAFRDESDPTSVERVYPNNPESALGPGVQFIGATVSTTDAPVTTGIGKRLTWLSDHYGLRLTPHYVTSPDPSLPDLLMHGYFKNTLDN
ncbi:hypothetical protein [Breoghania sp. JC706]|uniref:hypothetical protein n=1 Tax=Breoghania sp. JC706 TaxID=3117732 RepID=UPI0030085CEA